MTDFLMIFRGGDDEMAKLSPEAMQQHLQQWTAWIEGIRAKGQFKSGDPLAATGRVVSDQGQFTDGPYAEAKDLVGGYLIVSADDIDEVTEMAGNCPIYAMGGTTEIRPISATM